MNILARITAIQRRIYKNRLLFLFLTTVGVTIVLIGIAQLKGDSLGMPIIVGGVVGIIGFFLNPAERLHGDDDGVNHDSRNERSGDAG